MAFNPSVSRCEYKFISEPDDELKCLICLEVARDPLQHEACGKLFCKDCLEKHGKDKPCPNCRKGQSHYYVDRRGILFAIFQYQPLINCDYFQGKEP